MNKEIIEQYVKDRIEEISKTMEDIKKNPRSYSDKVDRGEFLVFGKQDTIVELFVILNKFKIAREGEVKEGCGKFLYEDEFEDPKDLFDHDVFCGAKLIRDNKQELCDECKDADGGSKQ